MLPFCFRYASVMRVNLEANECKVSSAAQVCWNGVSCEVSYVSIYNQDDDHDVPMDMCGVVWLGSVWLGWVWVGLAWLGFVWFGLVWLDLVWFGLVWFGLACRGLAWLSLVWFGLA